MKKFILVLYCILIKLHSQMVLLDESFQQTQFNDLQGWILSSAVKLNQGIDNFGSGISYAGLNSIKPQISFPYDSLFKYYQNIPPHNSIRLKITILNYHFPKYSLGVQTQMQVDGQSVYVLAEYFESEIEFNDQKIDLVISHSSSQLFIYIIYQSDQIAQISTMGVREYQLYYQKCPLGCVYCGKEDSTPIQCNLWVLSHTSLYSKGFESYNNDGWSIFQSNQLKKYKTTVCNYDLSFYILGVLGIEQKVSKIIILPPHYQVNIQYSIFILQTRFARNVNWIVEINNKTMLQVDFQTLFRQGKICTEIINLFNQPFDIQKEITLKTSHQNTTLVFTTYATRNAMLVYTMWSIRGFQIYVKKCHPSCQSCKGPRESDCTNIKYPNFIDIIKQFDTDTFADVGDWQVITPIQLRTLNQCNQVSLLGGYLQLQGEHFIQRLLNLPIHNNLEISFKLYRIDNFNNEKLYVLIDDEIIYEQTLELLADATLGVPLCGKYELMDKIYSIKIPQLKHTQEQSIIQIYSDQSTTSTGYWGIRDFQLKVNSKLFIKDFLQTQFDSVNWQTQDWSQTLKLQPIGICNGKNIIGGLNGLGNISKLRLLIKNIQDHIQIRLKFNLFVFQINEVQDKIINIKIDDNNPIQKTLKLQNNQICGQQSSIYNFEDIIYHSKNSVFLLIWMDSLQSTEFWGIRDVLIQSNNQGVN